MALITEDLAAYPNNAELAHKIKTQLGPDSEKAGVMESEAGFRPYLVGNGDLENGSSVEDRVTALNVLHSALSRCLERFAQLPGYEKADCMPYGLSECGFPTDGAAHHSAHENPTALISLTDSICHRRFSKECKMRFYVVCCLPEPWMVGLAEHLITVIGQGYVRKGGGLNYHLAGSSIIGVENLAEFQKRAHRDWVDENINQDGNSKTLLATLIKHVKALDGLSYDLTYKSKRHDELRPSSISHSSWTCCYARSSSRRGSLLTKGSGSTSMSSMRC